LKPTDCPTDLHSIMRVFVFSRYSFNYFPTMDELIQQLPNGANVVAYNLNDATHPYFMISFDEHNDVYRQWCANKDQDIYTFLGVDDKWKLFS